MYDNSLASLFEGRSVLVTGHTGFKGGWLVLWLEALGAQVTGLSLAPDQGPDNLFERASIANACRSRIGDIRDPHAVALAFETAKPSIVFHLAAQPLVRRSYRDPVGTFATNVMGTANVLEAARTTSTVEVVVCVTTDKVYENKEWCWPYRENEPLGGIDPYSASKSAAEMVARTYMSALKPERAFQIATARGGNVIGGGDWSEDRIVPDTVRAVRAGQPLSLRHPSATRPWQHVLDLCYGYLVLAARLAQGRACHGKAATDFVGAWNFGPDADLALPVSSLVGQMLATMGVAGHPLVLGESGVHESTYLRIDSSKARAELGWHPRLDVSTSMQWTAEWYRHYLADPTGARALVADQIRRYSKLCKNELD